MHKYIALTTANRPCRAPVIVDELLYFGCQDNKLYAVTTATLAEVWQNRGAFPPPPVFADGVMYSLASDGYLWALR